RPSSTRRRSKRATRSCAVSARSATSRGSTCRRATGRCGLGPKSSQRLSGTWRRWPELVRFEDDGRQARLRLDLVLVAVDPEHRLSLPDRLELAVRAAHSPLTLEHDEDL